MRHSVFGLLETCQLRRAHGEIGAQGDERHQHGNGGGAHGERAHGEDDDRRGAVLSRCDREQRDAALRHGERHRDRPRGSQPHTEPVGQMVPPTGREGHAPPPPRDHHVQRVEDRDREEERSEQEHGPPHRMGDRDAHRDRGRDEPDRHAPAVA